MAFQGLFAWGAQAAAPADEAALSPWSGLPLNKDCYDAYQTGLSVYQEAVDQKLKNSNEYFSSKMEAVKESCREDYSVGLLDARMYLQQSILIEYGMEMNFAAQKFGKESASYALYQRAIKSYIGDKLAVALLNRDLVESTQLDNPDMKRGLANMNLRLISEARHSHKAVQFGRFVYTAGGKPFTAFDYVVSPEGKLAELPSGELRVEKGSYQNKAEVIFQTAIKVAQAYVDYRPKMVIGEDSLLTAALAEMISKTEFRDTLRGQREAAPFEIMSALIQSAEQMQLDLKPLLEIQRHMLDKQMAVLERDIRATKLFLTGLCAAPVLPYAVRFGSWALSSYGSRLLVSYVRDGGVWKLNVGAFLYQHATTVSVLSSLISVIATRGPQIYFSIEEYRRNPKAFGLDHVLDSVMVSVVSAVPIAVGAPVLVAGTTIGAIEAGTYMVSETTAFLTQMRNGFQFAQSAGWKQAMIEVAKMASPRNVLKTWCSAWWTRSSAGRIVFNGRFIAMVFAYNVTSVIADISTRQMRSDPNDRFFTPHGINRLSVYSLTQKIMTSIVTAPIINIDNFWLRWGAWRFIDVLSTGLITFVVDGHKEVNWPYVTFEAVYGGTVSAAAGELERFAQLSIMNSNMSVSRSFWVQTFMKLAIMFPKAAVRNFAMDLYFDRVHSDHHSVAEFLKADMGVDLRNFSEEDIRQGIEEFRKDTEIVEMMKIPLDQLQQHYSKMH